MDGTAAVLLANSLSFVVYALAALWYVVPWLRKSRRASALAALLWVHAFRHVALQIFSAQRAGLAVPDRVRDQIAWGDVVGMVLALIALVALRARSRFAVAIVWVFAFATAADLGNSLLAGLRERMLGSAQGVTWLILVFYVPALWTTLALILWQLVARTGEPLDAAPTY